MAAIFMFIIAADTYNVLSWSIHQNLKIGVSVQDQLHTGIIVLDGSKWVFFFLVLGGTEIEPEGGKCGMKLSKLWLK